MLTKQQREEFTQRGFIRVRNAFSRDAALNMVNRFWRFLEEHQNVRRDNLSTWTEGIVSGIADLKHEPEFQEIGSPTTVGVLNDLLGKDNWQRPATWGQILATFPAPRWSWNSLLQGRVEFDTVCRPRRPVGFE